MSAMKWKKTYKLPTGDGTFKLFISEHNGGLFYSSILYWAVVGKRFLKAVGTSESGYLDFKLETRVSDSEHGALEEILEWATERFANVGVPVVSDDDA